MANNINKAIAYIRAGRSDAVTSIDRQRRDLERYAQVHDLDVVTTFEGIGQGLDLAGLMQRLDAGDADLLVVWRVDRDTRSVQAFADLFQRSQVHGWHLTTVHDGVIDTRTPARSVSSQAGPHTVAG